MLDIMSSAQAFFREALESALKRNPAELTDEAKVYLIHLLSEFSRSDKAFAGINYGENVVFFDLLERAYSSPESEKISVFRHLGDSSLYILGFFGTPGAKVMVSKEYYEMLGSEAYAQVSALSRLKAVHAAALFQELSERFSSLVKIIEMIKNYQPAENEN